MCGIWGFNGKNNFNQLKFNVLGVYNDVRGGDSCGVFTVDQEGNKSFRHGADKIKYYKNYIEEGAGYDLNGSVIALGHARKASIGAIGLAQAQPVVLTNAKEEPIFSMIHNGTLINYKELAEKYNVDYENHETDSQIFCKIVYYKGYGVLAEYEGAGAFVFYDKRSGDNVIKIFKGASLYYLNDNTLYIERPLFYMRNKNTGEFWFSSIEESLKFIKDSDDYEIKEVPHNVLITIKDGEIVDKVPYDRSERSQVKVMSYGSKSFPIVYNNNNSNRNFNRFRDSEIDFDGNDYDGYWENLRKNSSSFIREIKLSHPIQHDDWVRGADKVDYCSDGLYRIKNRLCNGVYCLSQAGYVGNPKFSRDFYSDYYFINGVLMKSYFDYLCGLKLCSNLAIQIGDNMRSIDASLIIYLAEFSVHPIPTTEKSAYEKDSLVFYFTDPMIGVCEYTGSFSPFFHFTKEEYHVINGLIVSCKIYSDKHVYVMESHMQKLDDKIWSEEISEAELTELILNKLEKID